MPPKCRYQVTTGCPPLPHSSCIGSHDVATRSLLGVPLSPTAAALAATTSLPGHFWVSPSPPQQLHWQPRRRYQVTSRCPPLPRGSWASTFNTPQPTLQQPGAVNHASAGQCCVNRQPLPPTSTPADGLSQLLLLQYTPLLIDYELHRAAATKHTPADGLRAAQKCGCCHFSPAPASQRPTAWPGAAPWPCTVGWRTRWTRQAHPTLLQQLRERTPPPLACLPLLAAAAAAVSAPAAACLAGASARDNQCCCSGPPRCRCCAGRPQSA